jgi:shikimate dehydrogenase
MSPDPGRGARPLVSGLTRVAAVIGDPIAHSLSPAIHNAAFAELGLDWVYVALLVPAGRGGEAVRAVPALGLAGLNVTMPHKADAAAACDELTSDARTLAAVNTVVSRAGGGLLGDSTDGAGFVDALLADGFDPAGRPCLVLGAGGAARAIVLALGRTGAGVTVAARRPEAAAAAAGLAPGATGAGLAEVDHLIAGVELVVNATPLGMAGEPPPFDPARLGPGQYVADTVYHPPETSLVAQARARGARTANGLGMLVHQAARSFERLTSLPPPLAAMWSGARAGLGGRA